MAMTNLNRSKTPEELAKERIERIEAAINLKEPDRIPLELNLDFGFKAKWAGITTYELFFDYEKACKALIKAAIDFPTDFPPLALIGAGSLLGFALRDYADIAPFVGVLTGPMHDILRDKYTRWPGRELSPNAGSFQFIGGEFLKPEEYEQFIDNPIKFMAEVIVPRAHETLEKPGSPEAMAALIRLGLEGHKYANFVSLVMKNLAELGYPLFVSIAAMVPLDFLGDFLRTIPGILLDLRKVPEKVKVACDVLMNKFVLDRIRTFEPPSHTATLPHQKKYPATKPFTGVPLHLNEYLSPKLYDEFYWPYLKRIIVESYNRGIKCLVGFEGRHDAHLEKLLELPKGWGIGLFEKTDIRKAKRVLEGHTCVMGGIPPTLLLSSTPKQIENYIKKLLEDTMEGGGLILASSTAIPAETPPENVKAVIKAVEKYGTIRR
ncbi:MAG: uroporphyrinogen decarboxylase family protein [Candidatus Bathyarchaeia archaeon]